MIDARRWDVLIRWTLEEGWTRGAEIGVLRGQTLSALMQCCPDLHMTAVDLWTPQTEQDRVREHGGRSYAEHDMGDYENLVRAMARHYGRITLLKGRSVEVAPLVPDGSLDFVFIDGDHTLAGVEADIHAWRPKVRPGGALTGHDAGTPVFPGVTQALDKHLPGWTLHPDHVWRFDL